MQASAITVGGSLLCSELDAAATDSCTFCCVENKKQPSSSNVQTNLLVPAQNGLVPITNKQMPDLWCGLSRRLLVRWEDICSRSRCVNPKTGHRGPAPETLRHRLCSLPLRFCCSVVSYKLKAGRTSYRHYLNAATFNGGMNMTVLAWEVWKKPQVICNTLKH